MGTPLQTTNATTSTPMFQSTATSQTVIYDKNGTQVPLSDTSQKSVIQPRSLQQPTSIKWLKPSQEYQSEPFSGAGMRYSGYMFGLKGCNFAVMKVKGGNFTCFITDRAEATAVVKTAYLTVEGSPYTIESNQFFYFGVNNPNAGQNYYVRAVYL